MNLFKFLLYSLLIFFNLFTTASLYAAETGTVDKQAIPSSSNNNVVIVADVNVDEAKITSQDSTTVRIDFTLSNGIGIQAGVKYGIELIKDGTQYISDQKVYDDSITLYENTTLKKSIVYEAPSNLTGNYTLVLSVENAASFPLGVKTVGKIKLTASTKGIMILQDTCYLQVDGEKGSPRYTLNQGVDINASESLTLTCTAINDGKAVSTSPIFETRYINAYGDIVPNLEGKVNPISFLKGEKKVFTVPLPKVVKHQFYMVKIVLSSATSVSNAVSLNYIVHGAKGMIHNITIDKDNYVKGENGSFSVLWSATAGIFTRNNESTQESPEVTLNATIEGEKGVCATSVKEKLMQSKSVQPTIMPFTTTSDCVNPHIKATLTDNEGIVLDQKDFRFISNPANPIVQERESKNKPLPQNYKYGIIGGGLIIFLLIGVLLKKKNNSTVTNA